MSREIVDPFYICLMKTEAGIAVMANDDGSIAARQHSHEWVGEFEQMYNSNHAMGYTRSMSACINAITFQPSFIRVDGLDDIKARVLDPETAQLTSYRNNAGGFDGIRSKTDLSKLWKKGIKPRLIS